MGKSADFNTIKYGKRTIVYELTKGSTSTCLGNCLKAKGKQVTFSRKIKQVILFSKKVLQSKYYSFLSFSGYMVKMNTAAVMIVHKEKENYVNIQVISV